MLSAGPKLNSVQLVCRCVYTVAIVVVVFAAVCCCLCFFCCCYWWCCCFCCRCSRFFFAREKSTHTHIHCERERENGNARHVFVVDPFIWICSTATHCHFMYINSHREKLVSPTHRTYLESALLLSLLLLLLMLFFSLFFKFANRNTITISSSLFLYRVNQSTICFCRPNDNEQSKKKKIENNNINVRALPCRLFFERVNIDYHQFCMYKSVVFFSFCFVSCCIVKTSNLFAHQDQVQIETTTRRIAVGYWTLVVALCAKRPQCNGKQCVIRYPLSQWTTTIIVNWN